MELQKFHEKCHDFSFLEEEVDQINYQASEEKDQYIPPTTYIQEKEEVFSSTSDNNTRSRSRVVEIKTNDVNSQRQQQEHVPLFFTTHYPCTTMSHTGTTTTFNYAGWFTTLVVCIPYVENFFPIPSSN